jgi:xanthine dehydrogenase accessory factor
MPSYFDDIKSALESGRSFAAATIVQIRASSPREPGAKMGVFADGSTFGTIGGGLLEKLVVEDSLAAIRDGKPVFKKYKLMPEESGGIGTECGGEVEVFIDVFLRDEKIILLGAGHVGYAVAKIAAILEMPLEVIDDRTEFANPARFPGAKIHNTAPKDTDFGSIITKKSSVIIVTRSHDIDAAALRGVLKHDCFYVGMIASKRKSRVILDMLEKEGFSRESLDRVHTPIGLDIGAETPGEISLSIMSEIVSLKRLGKSPCSLKGTAHEGK